MIRKIEGYWGLEEDIVFGALGKVEVGDYEDYTDCELYEILEYCREYEIRMCKL